MDTFHEVVRRYVVAYEKERDKEEAMKQHANKTKEHLIDGYWEARWYAGLKLRAALILYDAVKEG